MFREWLTSTSVAAFLRRHLHQHPYARPDAAQGTVPTFGRDTLEQVLGEYFLRDNMVDRQKARSACPDFALFRHEVSPLATVRLLPGDWLYIPSRWWHVAKCVEDALSISVGVFPHDLSTIPGKV